MISQFSWSSFPVIPVQLSRMLSQRRIDLISRSKKVKNGEVQKMCFFFAFRSYTPWLSTGWHRMTFQTLLISYRLCIHIYIFIYTYLQNPGLSQEWDVAAKGTVIFATFAWGSGARKPSSGQIWKQNGSWLAKLGNTLESVMGGQPRHIKVFTKLYQGLHLDIPIPTVFGKTLENNHVLRSIWHRDRRSTRLSCKKSLANITLITSGSIVHKEHVQLSFSDMELYHHPPTGNLFRWWWNLKDHLDGFCTHHRPPLTLACIHLACIH